VIFNKLEKIVHLVGFTTEITTYLYTSWGQMGEWRDTSTHS